MTAITKVNLETGTKSTHTIWVKNNQNNKNQKSKKNKSDYITEQRNYLSALSRELKKAHKEKIDQAETQEQAERLQTIGTNELLLTHYKETTGAKEFHTFKQWKEKGFCVNKGQQSFRFWGTPLGARDKSGDSEDHSKDSFFPMCCVFSDQQVSKVDKCLSMLKSTDKKTTSTINPKENTPVHTVPREKFGDPKLASRFVSSANNLQKKIDNAFSDRQENTAKRIAQAARARQEGYRLQRTQHALRALAKRHQEGDVPTALNKIKSKKSVYDLLGLRLTNVENGYHSYYVETDEPANTSEEAQALWQLIKQVSDVESQRDAEEQKHILNTLPFAKIPGYFPTPEAVVRKMIRFADIHQGDVILEPEAGTGAILDIVKQHEPRAEIVGYEINATLHGIVSKHYSQIRHEDFLQVTPKPIADKVLMNPPFERLKDSEHIQHAFQFLKPGGALVAIMSSSAFFRKDKKAQQFREWFSLNSGHEEDLPENSFKNSGTCVQTKIIYLVKS